MWIEDQGSLDVVAPTALAYTIDLALSRARGELAIVAREAEPGPLSSAEAVRERHVAATLSHARRSRSQLFYNALLPLARAGRCDVVVEEGAAPVPLAADDYPYRAHVFVEERDDDGILVRGELHRDAERLDLRELTALLPRDDIAFVGARVIRVRTDDAAAVLSRILREGVLEVHREDVRDTLAALWAACGPRTLTLPPAYETVAGRALPLRTHAILVTPERGGARRAPAFAVEIVFDYDGVRVPWQDRRNYHADFDRKRIVQRDRSLELDAIEELVGAGFRPRQTATGEPALTLASSKLTAAVALLPSDRFVVEADGLRVRTSSCASMSIRSGIDWFDLRAHVSFDGVVAPMPAILAAVRRGDGLVRLGPHGTGVLPSAWLDRLERVMGLAEDAAADEALRFQRGQVALVGEILEGDDAVVSWDEPIAQLRRELAAQAAPALAPTPPGFAGELRDYQRAGLTWMRGLERLGFSGCLADDMGLGKTIQVLALLVARKAEARARGTTLIVAPRSVVHNWLDEARRFAPSLRAIEHRRGAASFDGVDVAVTTYATLRNDLESLAKVTFDYVVLDEAHAIKSSRSATARAARRLVSRSRLALTGTPVENHLGELASLFAFLNPGMLGPSVKATAKRGFEADKREIARIGRGLSPFLLRRRKADVLAELPPRVEQTIRVVLGEEQRSIYERVKRHYRETLLARRRSSPPAGGRGGIEVLAALTRLRQLAVHPALVDRGESGARSAKMDALFEHLEPIAAQGKKALVFSQFTSMLDLVEAELTKRALAALRLDGNTKDRKTVVARFQHDPAVPVFLVSLKAGGVGLNLTAAEYVFLLDPWWNPAAEAQAIDRAHRMGQTASVMAYRLVSVDTIEERLMDLQDKKRDLVASVFGEHEGPTLRTMTVQDLDALLS